MERESARLAKGLQSPLDFTDLANVNVDVADPTVPADEHLRPASYAVCIFGAVLLLVMMTGAARQPGPYTIGGTLLSAGMLGGVLYLTLRIHLRERRARTSRRLLESLPCYAYLIDRNFRLIWINEMLRNDLGTTEGSECYSFFKNRSEPCEDCASLKSLESGDVSGTEKKFSRRNGDLIDAVVYSSPIQDRSGTVAAFLEIAVNITSIKQMQQRLALLGQTIAGMAHSIKNIMMGLDGGIYVVNKGLEANDRKEIKEGWDIVLYNFDKIFSLVQDILYCSKERDPEFSRVDPNEVIREVYDLYAQTAKSYGVDLKLNLDDGATSAVLDRKGLHTVLANLVSNAIDACKTDFWKEEHEVELRSSSRPDGSVVFEVSDNGVGMDSEVSAHAFEDFFSSKGNQGTGLGLMVTQKIVEEHGGSIDFRSAPGQGTTFIAVFPPHELEQE